MVPDDDFPDDAELDEWLAEEEAADGAAAHILRVALADQRGRPAPADELAAAAAGLRRGLRLGGDPYDLLARGADFGQRPPDDDAELVLQCLAATIAPREDTGADPEEQALVLSMKRADWLGAVVETVRAGAGAAADPEALVRAVGTCPEVEVGDGWDPQDETLVEATFELVSWPWQAIGVLDDDRRLTALGAWALPRALARAWGSDLDAEA